MTSGKPLSISQIDGIKQHYLSGRPAIEAAALAGLSERTFHKWYRKFRTGEEWPGVRAIRNGANDGNFYGSVTPKPFAPPNCIPSVLHKIRAGRA